MGNIVELVITPGNKKTRNFYLVQGHEIGTFSLREMYLDQLICKTNARGIMKK